MGDLLNTTGTLETDQLIRLDRPISLTSRRVRIILQPLPGAPRTGKSLVAWIKTIRADLKKRDYQFRPKAEIDQQLKAERDSW
jgi:hypothetical protein